MEAILQSHEALAPDREDDLDPISDLKFQRGAAPEARISRSRTWASSRRVRVAAVVLGVLLALGAGVWIWESSNFEATDNAFVEASVHPVSSRVAGDVVEVLVEDNQSVVKGQVLARLDSRDATLKVHSAEADLAGAGAQVLQARAAVTTARAKLRECEAQVEASSAQQEKARLDQERAKQLFEGASRAISKQEFDAAQSGLDVSSGALGVARAAREAAAASVEASGAALAAAESREMGARAALENAQLQLSFTEIVAGEGGRIAKKRLESGQRVAPGQALMAVVSDKRWIVANFKENQMERIRPGQPVEIRVDALPGTGLRGTVESIAPGTGAEFSLLPPDNATGNFLKIVQRVPVKIVLDGFPGLEDRLLPGLSATARVRVGG